MWIIWTNSTGLEVIFREFVCYIDWSSSSKYIFHIFVYIVCYCRIYKMALFSIKPKRNGVSLYIYISAARVFYNLHFYYMYYECFNSLAACIRGLASTSFAELTEKMMFVCWGLMSLLNIWGHIATVATCSSGTLTNVLPHRNAMPQT